MGVENISWLLIAREMGGKDSSFDENWTACVQGFKGLDSFLLPVDQLISALFISDCFAAISEGLDAIVYCVEEE